MNVFKAALPKMEMLVFIVKAEEYHDQDPDL